MLRLFSFLLAIALIVGGIMPIQPAAAAEDDFAEAVCSHSNCAADCDDGLEDVCSDLRMCRAICAAGIIPDGLSGDIAVQPADFNSELLRQLDSLQRKPPSPPPW